MTNKCTIIDCDQIAFTTSANYLSQYCKFHHEGGIFGSGETFTQYQIIESDLLEFINYVPVNDNNLKVYSPFLRDIILRACVQIEIFLKEWAKYLCSTGGNKSNLLDKFNNKNGKGVRNWNFVDYFPLKQFLRDNLVVHLMLNSSDIKPFADWHTSKDYPNWWELYNSIKHDSHNSISKCNLHMALESSAALFYLHCSFQYSRNYLSRFVRDVIKFDDVGNVSVERGSFSTPIDNKKYLFKIVDLDHPSKRKFFPKNK